ncbi:MAG TPA: hypothetical protein VEH06_01785 [Candidatus Bathyarchaeia archaeon]|nr:hypothetical protein [Candidatus Bathyarchaeia archaeon]
MSKKESKIPTSEDAGPKEPTSYSPASISEQHHSVERVLDETRDNIRRTIEEARRDIPRNTQALNDCQEQYLKSAREFTDEFLNSQKEIVKSLQSTWAPYVESGYQEFWSNWTSPQRTAEIYAKIVSNFADNVMTSTRIANNRIFATIDEYKSFVQHVKDDVKEFSRLATNNARAFEDASREFTRTA